MVKDLSFSLFSAFYTKTINHENNWFADELIMEIFWNTRAWQLIGEDPLQQSIFPSSFWCSQHVDNICLRTRRHSGPVFTGTLLTSVCHGWHDVCGRGVKEGHDLGDHSAGETYSSRVRSPAHQLQPAASSKCSGRLGYKSTWQNTKLRWSQAVPTIDLLFIHFTLSCRCQGE